MLIIGLPPPRHGAAGKYEVILCHRDVFQRVKNRNAVVWTAACPRSLISRQTGLGGCSDLAGIGGECVWDCLHLLQLCDVAAEISHQRCHAVQAGRFSTICRSRCCERTTNIGDQIQMRILKGQLATEKQYKTDSVKMLTQKRKIQSLSACSTCPVVRKMKWSRWGLTENNR